MRFFLPKPFFHDLGSWASVPLSNFYVSFEQGFSFLFVFFFLKLFFAKKNFNSSPKNQDVNSFLALFFFSKQHSPGHKCLIFHLVGRFFVMLQSFSISLFCFPLSILKSLSCCVKTGENDRFQHKKCIKTQNFKSSNWIKNQYKSSSGPKECQKNHF